MVRIAGVVAIALAAGPIEVAHRRVITEDGASLALYRYAPPGGGLTHRAILLLADFGFGRALFDALPGDSLARELAGRGAAVYVAELRGQGASSRGASLRSLVHLDLPAIARVITYEHPGRFDLVAHGWLGTLALAATTHELPVERVVAINTPVTFEATPKLLESLLEQGGHFSAFANGPIGASAFDILFVNHSDIEPKVLEFVRSRTTDVPAPMAREWLAWMQSGDLPLDDGSSIRSRLHDYNRPTLLVLGLADSVAGPEYCVALQKTPTVRVRTFSRFDSGDDFSHVTSLVGTNARRLLYPEMTRFLFDDEAAR